MKDAPDAELEADGQSSVHSAGPLRSALMLELLLGRARWCSPLPAGQPSSPVPGPSVDGYASGVLAEEPHQFG